MPASAMVSTIEGSFFQPWIIRFAPTGLSVRSRTRARSSRPWGESVSITPMPPASETATASWALAMKVIGAWTIGMSMPRRSCTRLVTGQGYHAGVMFVPRRG